MSLDRPIVSWRVLVGGVARKDSLGLAEGALDACPCTHMHASKPKSGQTKREPAPLAAFLMRTIYKISIQHVFLPGRCSRHINQISLCIICLH
jgi:hypothetical protein